MVTVAQSKDAPDAAARRPARWLRVVLSALLVIHLAAIFAPPYRFASLGPRGSAPTAETLTSFLKPYIEFAYLDHGYFFFAPNPGASHLLQATYESPDEERIQRRFPDRRLDWPRLLYHRHFMLGEWLNAGFAPSRPPAEILGSPTDLETWQRQRHVYEMVRHSYEKHLKMEYGVTHLELDRIEHRPPELSEFRDLGWKLDDKRLYSVMSEDSMPAPIFPDSPRPTGPLIQEEVIRP